MLRWFIFASTARQLQLHHHHHRHDDDDDDALPRLREQCNSLLPPRLGYYSTIHTHTHRTLGSVGFAMFCEEDDDDDDDDDAPSSSPKPVPARSKRHGTAGFGMATVRGLCARSHTVTITLSGRDADGLRI